MELPYQTPADPTLPHQVVFLALHSKVRVSCNCLATSQGHDIMGTADGKIEKARALYNDPANHRGPFTSEDEAKW